MIQHERAVNLISTQVISRHVSINGRHAPRHGRLRLRVLVRQRPRALVARARIIPGRIKGQGRKRRDAVALGLERRRRRRLFTIDHEVLDPDGLFRLRGGRSAQRPVREVRRRRDL